METDPSCGERDIPHRIIVPVLLHVLTIKVFILYNTYLYCIVKVFVLYNTYLVHATLKTA